jgi:multidrug efflux pump subunit AcrA (membrane-fusion protein)
MITELEVDNPKLELIPGMYATVVLKVQRRPQALAIPIESISAGKINSVFVVDANNELEERTVTLGSKLPLNTKFSQA